MVKANHWFADYLTEIHRSTLKLPLPAFKSCHIIYSYKYPPAERSIISDRINYSDCSFVYTYCLTALYYKSFNCTVTFLFVCHTSHFFCLSKVSVSCRLSRVFHISLPTAMFSISSQGSQRHCQASCDM